MLPKCGRTRTTIGVRDLLRRPLACRCFIPYDDCICVTVAKRDEIFDLPRMNSNIAGVKSTDKLHNMAVTKDFILDGDGRRVCLFSSYCSFLHDFVSDAIFCTCHLNLKRLTCSSNGKCSPCSPCLVYLVCTWLLQGDRALIA